jgi:hypothetical protein
VEYPHKAGAADAANKIAEAQPDDRTGGTSGWAVSSSSPGNA